MTRVVRVVAELVAVVAVASVVVRLVAEASSDVRYRHPVDVHDSFVECPAFQDEGFQRAQLAVVVLA